MATVLFCPFCREPFEGVAECPDHGVSLVTLGSLAASDARRAPDDDATLAMHDMRFGRGVVLLGALVTWLSLFLPAVHDGFREGTETTGFALWQLRADYLMVVPGAAMLAAFAVMTRTTRAQLRRIRLALAIALGLAMVAILVAAHHVATYAAASRAAGEVGEVSAGSGAFAALFGLGLVGVGIVRLGGASGRAALRTRRRR